MNEGARANDDHTDDQQCDAEVGQAGDGARADDAHTDEQQGDAEVEQTGDGAQVSIFNSFSFHPPALFVKSTILLYFVCFCCCL